MKSMIYYKLNLPVPPSVNHYKRPTKTGRFYLTEDAKRYHWEVAYAVRDAGIEDVTDKPLTVLIECYPQRNNRDIDNILKVLFDALEGRVYQNDKQIKCMLVEMHKRDKDNPRIEITIADYQLSVWQKLHAVFLNNLSNFRD